MNATGAPVRVGAEAGDGGPVCVIDKNTCEQVRFDLQEYRRHRLLSVRLWWRRDDSDPWKPSKRGFGLHVEALPELVEGLRHLETEAERRGWVEESGEAPHSTTQPHTRAKSVNHEGAR